MAVRRIAGGGNERLHRREARFNHHVELEMFEESLEAPRRPGVRAERDAHAAIDQRLEIALRHLEARLILLPGFPPGAAANLFLALGILELFGDTLLRAL